MRRNRSIREHRNDLIRKRAASASDRRKIAHKRLLKQKEKDRQLHLKKAEAEKRGKHSQRRVSFYEKIKNKRNKRQLQVTDFKQCPSYYPLQINDLIPFDEYNFSYSRPLNICHTIHSLGLGGAQTMMFELVHSLDKYFGENINNSVVLLYKKKTSPGPLSKAYEIPALVMQQRDLKDHCKNNNIDIVIQHRTAMARCIKSFLPDKVKYVLLNHTWHNMQKMRDFLYCDCYLSVCNFLNRRTQWPEFIHPSRKRVILNGVETDYLQDIEPRDLGPGFHTGRCHRMVGGKFRIDSLQWMIGKVKRNIPDFHHHIIGQHPQSKAMCKKADFLHYYGTIIKRHKKMSIIKSLDTYFYETFQEEGASVAILESLACGVPVICKPRGGNNELVKDKINGFLVSDRSDFLMRMMQMSSKKSLRQHMRQQAMEDFDKRLHVRHTACKYMQLFETLVDT